ncbi:NAD(P)/FAD-dependent oxidoreductase [Microbulbifer sp. SAOS-129_SWC]|uniref:NAD(P)/FAD-dependent oxidoreductase n=1 Tax=Microbulbifer sp. SAOS-129_SWC TaxID=3145235 RepID=UPI0032173627
MPGSATPDTTDFDVAVVGGSYAGMSAALQLARGRRRVLVLDSGQRRNRFASHAHGVLTQDGRPPGDIAADGRNQLLRYPNVTWVDGNVGTAEKVGDQFRITLDTETDTETNTDSGTGTSYLAARLILATGVRDELPEVPGLAERWGRSVFHCPYCHGYELNGAAIGCLAMGEMSVHQALVLPDWGPTTLFTNNYLEPDAEQLRQLALRKVSIERTPVTGISGEHATIHLQDGRTIDLAGLYIAPQMRQAAPLAQQLGCAIEDTPVGEMIQTDEKQATTVPGVFACGDSARAKGSVTFAMADGAMAGIAAHASLMFAGLE